MFEEFSKKLDEYVQVPPDQISQRRSEVDIEAELASSFDTALMALNKAYESPNDKIKEILAEFALIVKRIPRHFYENQTDAVLGYGMEIATPQCYQALGDLGREFEFYTKNKIDFLLNTGVKDHLAFYLVNQALLNSSAKEVVIYLCAGGVKRMCGTTVQKKMIILEIALLILKQVQREHHASVLVPLMLGTLNSLSAQFIKGDKKVTEAWDASAKTLERQYFLANFPKWVQSFIKRSTTAMKNYEETKKAARNLLTVNGIMTSTESTPAQFECLDPPSSLVLKHYYILYCFDLLAGLPQFEGVSSFPGDQLKNTRNEILTGLLGLHNNALDLLNTLILQWKYYNFMRTREPKQFATFRSFNGTDYYMETTYNPAGVLILLQNYRESETIASIQSNAWHIHLSGILLLLMLQLEEKSNMIVLALRTFVQCISAEHTHHTLEKTNEFGFDLIDLLYELLIWAGSNVTEKAELDAIKGLVKHSLAIFKVEVFSPYFRTELL
jgi:hypothetical protein